MNHFLAWRLQTALGLPVRCRHFFVFVLMLLLFTHRSSSSRHVEPRRTVLCAIIFTGSKTNRGDGRGGREIARRFFISTPPPPTPVRVCHFVRAREART